MVKISVVMAIHNRREDTLRCLRSLFLQKGHGTVFEYLVTVVDDGSSDGSSDAIKTQFPVVRVYRSNGDLYWCKSMCKGFAHQADSEKHFVLLINDDVRLHMNAISDALHDLRIHGETTLLIGSTTSESEGCTTYGGLVRPSRLKPMHFSLLPAGTSQSCDVGNMNFCMASAVFFNRFGFLDESFSHGMADFDFCMRASKRGAKIVTIAKAVGTCEKHLSGPAYLNPQMPFKVRIRNLLSQKGLPPRDWWRLNWRHGGLMALASFIAPYVKFLTRLR